MHSLPGELEVPVTAADVDASWLTSALGLGTVTAVTSTPIGTGNIACTLRLDVSWAAPGGAPGSFVVKLAAPDPARRRAGMAWRTYEIEAAFYGQIAPGLEARLPHCYWAGFDPEREAYAVVLEDLSGFKPGDELTGCDPADAEGALAELALVHGPHWGDASLAGLAWFNRWPEGQARELGAELAGAVPEVLERFGERLSPDAVAVATRFASLSSHYDRKGAGGPRTVAHGDFRNDNLMFGGDRVCVLDWQTCHYGSGLADASYYLGGALPTEDRRAHEVDLLRCYHGRLTAQGIPLSWDACWAEYRRHALSLLTTALKGAHKAPMEGRAAEMVLVLADRAARHVLDLGSLELLEA